MVTIDEVKRILRENGVVIKESPSRLGNDTGYTLKTDGGAIVNVFDKGTYSVQGKNTEQVKPILEASFGGQDAL